MVLHYFYHRNNRIVLLNVSTERRKLRCILILNMHLEGIKKVNCPTAASNIAAIQFITDSSSIRHLMFCTSSLEAVKITKVIYCLKYNECTIY
jgi:hypothetical protein